MRRAHNAWRWCCNALKILYSYLLMTLKWYYYTMPRKIWSTIFFRNTKNINVFSLFINFSRGLRHTLCWPRGLKFCTKYFFTHDQNILPIAIFSSKKMNKTFHPIAQASMHLWSTSWCKIFLHLLWKICLIISKYYSRHQNGEAVFWYAGSSRNFVYW